MKAFLIAGTLAAFWLGAADAQAKDNGQRAGFLARADIEYGGDDIVSVEFEDGDTQDVKAGQGITVGIGGWFRPVADTPFELQAMLGYKYATTAADNADIKITRTVLRLDGLYRFENDWFATAGIVRHQSPKLDGDDFFPDFEFDDATGFNVGFGWKWISLNYTKIEYSSDLFEDVDASSVGISIAYRFGAPD